VWGYHLSNLTIHILAALVLFGVVRQTLVSERLREQFGRAATGLSLTVALIWTVHPLQTESVTYIIQRTESLMGLFLLLTLYCAIRSFDSPRPRRWQVAAVLACALGMGSKEVMIGAPILVLLYDWIFVGSSFREIWRRRWALYAGLAATWVLLALLVATGQARQAVISASFAQLGSSAYAKTQCGVILYYLRLSLWPHPLVVDYNDWPIAKTAMDFVPWAVVLGAMLCATLVALWRRSWLGFPGAWFLIILAPSSSLIPIISEPAAERRMYLPLAAVVVLITVIGYKFLSSAVTHIGLQRVWFKTIAPGAVIVRNWRQSPRKP
jgi:hypothetical protein